MDDALAIRPLWKHSPKTCTLTFHDEAFSKHEVLLNESLFQSWKLTNGTPLQFSTSVTYSRRSSNLDLDGKIVKSSKTHANDIVLVFKYREAPPEVLSKFPNLEISVSENIASSLNLVKRSPVVISQIGEDECQASHVEIAFRDAYLTRADMWRLACSELAGKALYKGQKISFLNAIRAQVKSIYHQGNKLTSGFFASSTKPIFRSDSARYVIFLQMSKEMWDFEPEGSGEIVFNKVIDGFLPELFQRWSKNGARHLISIVLFTRMEYPAKEQMLAQHSKDDMTDVPTYRDFYRVLTSNMESGQHETVLLQLKRDFKTFLRDVSVRPASELTAASLFRDGLFAGGNTSLETIQGRPAPATRGNILEAINTASSQFSEDYIDRDLLRTGLSIVVVTPGAGVFEVDAGLLNLTTDLLIENGVGIDLVCLARMPLHSVPLFKYRKPQQAPVLRELSVSDSTPKSGHAMPDGDVSSTHAKFASNVPLSSRHSIETPDLGETWSYAIPHWLDVSFWTPKSAIYDRHNDGIRNFTPSKTKQFLTRVKMYEVQMMGIMENETNSISIPYLEPYRASMFAKDLRIEPEAVRAFSNDGSLRNFNHISNSYGVRLDSTSVSPSPRSPSNIDGAKILSNLGRYMEDYDDRTFEAGKPASKVLEEQTRPLPTRSRTMQSENSSSTKKRSNISTTSSIDHDPPRKPALLGTIPSKSSTAVMTRRTSNVSLFNKSSNSTGSVKGNRSLGMAFKGFGSLATKATAQIEVSSETAHRESLLSHALKSLPTPARLDSSTTVPTATIPNEKHTTSTSTDDERIPSYPTSPVSKPIDIRHGRQENHSSQEQNSFVPDFEASQVLKADALLSQSSEINLMRVPGKRSNIMRDFAPWFTILNPSNPELNEVDPSSRLGRWHHVFPRPLHASTIKWKSLCAPASIPLTTEGFPMADEIASEYDVNTWLVSESQPLSSEPEYQSDFWLLRELICSRFSNGFQMVVGNHIADVIGDERLRTLDVFNDEQILKQGSPIYMSKGIHIQSLTSTANDSVEVKQFTRIRGQGFSNQLGKKRDLIYIPHIRTALSPAYEQRKITISRSHEGCDWQRLDMFIAGHQQELGVDIPEELKYWRARYVLIPMQPSSNIKKISSLSPEDNEEEIRLEGLYRLTQMWQKSRHTPVKEPRQRVITRALADTNPLDIIFRTKPPSVVVALELHDSLLEKDTSEAFPRNLLPESELLNREAIDLKLLAQLLQSEKGIKMQNRRWHLRLHDYCFIGLEFVTWLVDNFRDIDNREVAVEFGEQLMREGLFIHVEKRHNFRDGNFFYQMSPEYQQRKATSWLSKFASVPSTPVAETKNSPRIRPQSSQEDSASEDGMKTPTERFRARKVVLSKKLVYDVDRKRKSYKKEIINLHYDRVSSADDCYHIRINWLNVTPKLVEDAVSSWASAVERYGLRLVEIPISEASRINELHAFRSPYIVKLAKQPPEPPLPSAKSTTIRFPYHRALLKKFNFVLDLEAAEDFPQSVDVSYSWGKPDYQHPQFISRDGILLAQITEDGNFLLVANRLSNNRRGTQGVTPSRTHLQGLSDVNMQKSHMMQSTTLTASQTSHNKQAATHTASSHFPPPRFSPFASPMVRATPDVGLNLSTRSDLVTPHKLKNDLEKFCNDPRALDGFYEEVGNERSAMILVVPTLPNTPSMGPIGESEGEGDGKGNALLPPVPALKDYALSSAGAGSAKK